MLVKEDSSKPQLSPRGHQDAGICVLHIYRYRAFVMLFIGWGNAFKCLARYGLSSGLAREAPSARS